MNRTVEPKSNLTYSPEPQTPPSPAIRSMVGLFKNPRSLSLSLYLSKGSLSFSLSVERSRRSRSSLLPSPRRWTAGHLVFVSLSTPRSRKENPHKNSKDFLFNRGFLSLFSFPFLVFSDKNLIFLVLLQTMLLSQEPWLLRVLSSRSLSVFKAVRTLSDYHTRYLFSSP